MLWQEVPACTSLKINYEFLVKIVDFHADIVYNIIAGKDALYTHDTEFTFKRHVMSSVMRTAVRRFFFFKEVC